MLNPTVSFGNRVKRVVALVPAVIATLMWVACGGTPTNTTTSGAVNRAFITNTYSGDLQIVDSQNDTTPMSAETTNSAGQLVPGSPVTISVSTTVTLEAESPDHTTTAVYDPSSNLIYFITNSSETSAGDVALSSATGGFVFSPDSTTVYAPEPNLSISSGSHTGGVEVVSRANLDIAATYAVPSAKYAAISSNGQYLLVFADNSDSLWLINLQATTVSPVEIGGFARPVNAFFSSDGNTAYVLNCGPECGSGFPASVASFNIPSQTITATVPVGGASVGLLNGTTLYVAGSPVPPGTTSTFDAVNVSNMTRMTTNSVAIGDGFHTSMALAPNNKLYIGATSCSNTVTGCLSVVNVANNTADAPLPPRGAITSLLSISNRNVIYAIEGGYLHIYDSTNDALVGPSFTFTGALYGIVQADPVP